MIYLIGARRKFNIFNPSSQLPALIRKIARIPYNHVMLQDSDRKLVAEAIKTGVVIRDLNTALQPQDEIAVYEYKEPINYEVQLVYLISSIGHKYDFKELLWYQLIWNIFGWWLWGTKDKNDKFICYSLASYVFLDDDYYKVKPKEFLKKFKIIGSGNIHQNSDQLDILK